MFLESLFPQTASHLTTTAPGYALVKLISAESLLEYIVSRAKSASVSVVKPNTKSVKQIVFSAIAVLVSALVASSFAIAQPPTGPEVSPNYKNSPRSVHLHVELDPYSFALDMMTFNEGRLFDSGNCTNCPDWPDMAFLRAVIKDLQGELQSHTVDFIAMHTTQSHPTPGVFNKAEGEWAFKQYPGVPDLAPLWNAAGDYLRGEGNPHLANSFDDVPEWSIELAEDGENGFFTFPAGVPPFIIFTEGTVETQCGPVQYTYNQTLQPKPTQSIVDHLGLSMGAQLQSRINFTLSGDCECRDIGGRRIGVFNLTYQRLYGLVVTPETLNNNEVINRLEPVVRGSRCFGEVDCNCPVEEDDIGDAMLDDAEGIGMIGSDVSTDSRATVTVAPFPVGQGLQFAADSNCSTDGTPCDPRAKAAASEALQAVAAELPAEMAASISPRFRVGNNTSPAELRKLLLRFVEANMTETSTGRPGHEFAGSVQTSCGSVGYQVLLTIRRRSQQPVLEAEVKLAGTCDCGTLPTELKAFTAEYFVMLDPSIVRTSLTEFSVNFVPVPQYCSVSPTCCANPAEDTDAFPLVDSDGFILEWDSPEWCTYGGGGVTIGPGGTTTTPPPVPPGEGGGNGGGTPPVPPGEGGGNNGGGLPPVPPAEGGNGGEDNGGGIPPVPPADDNGGDDGDDNGGHDGENGGENGGDDGDPPAPPVINLTIKATSATLAQGANVAGAGMLVQINTGDPSQVPGDTGAIPDDSGSADGELSGTTDANGELQLEVPAAVAAALGGTLLNIDTTPYSGLVMTFAGEVDAASVLPGELMPYVQQAVMFGGNTYIPLLIPEAMVAGLQGLIDSANTLGVEINICIDPKPLSDPYFGTRGSWEQPYPDQWAIQRVGFTQRDSAWDLVKPKGEPVIVAVVDSGLDWNHREIDWDSLWRNPGEVPGNGIDDDNNGYIDDTIGWDFWDNDRKPWDNDGHGTFVAGVMFANPDNGEGIAGVARHARLMVLKAMNAFGHTRATSVAQAIKYAADNGARVINLSLGGPESSTVVREAIDYAHGKNAVVVVAAGNEAVPAENQSVAGLPNALTVAATGYDDTRSVYSNYGAGIDLAAPGDDILSLRARRTDLLKNLPGVDYETESAFVGEDRRYYRASGTSFAAPIVSGVAALVIANNPELSADEVMRVLKQSANDVETTGVDHFTGYGIVDAAAALKADPDVYVEASISGVTVAEREGAQALLVNGAMGADRFEKATISIGKGENPDEWEQITMLKKPINGELTGIPATRFAGAKVWIIRLQVEHKNGQTREFRFRLALG